MDVVIVMVISNGNVIYVIFSNLVIFFFDIRLLLYYEIKRNIIKLNFSYVLIK